MTPVLQCCILGWYRSLDRKGIHTFAVIGLLVHRCLGEGKWTFPNTRSRAILDIRGYNRNGRRRECSLFSVTAGSAVQDAGTHGVRDDEQHGYCAHAGQHGCGNDYADASAWYQAKIDIEMD